MESEMAKPYSDENGRALPLAAKFARSPLRNTAQNPANTVSKSSLFENPRSPLRNPAQNPANTASKSSLFENPRSPLRNTAQNPANTVSKTHPL